MVVKGGPCKGAQQRHTTTACLCRWVDEVVRDAPWVINESFIDKHSIDYVTHDALPYSDSSGQANDVYDFVSLASWLLRITVLLMVRRSGMPELWWLPSPGHSYKHVGPTWCLPAPALAVSALCSS